MRTVKEVYANKRIIGSMDNYYGLIENINKESRSLLVASDNYDGTIMITYENEEHMDNFQDVFKNALLPWLQQEITCPIQYTYDLMRINSKQSVLII